MTRTRTRTLIAAAIAAAAVAALSGCSTISTEPDQVALHYSGGSFSSKNFQGCVNSGTRETDGHGDTHFVYPTSQRTYASSLDKNAESKPFTVVSKDNVELAAPVTVTFTLNTDCTERDVNGKHYKGGVLQLFHETLGNRYHAYWNADGEGDANADGIPDRWVDFLRFAIGQPLDTGYDRVAQGYNWRDLWNNPATKVEVEKALNEKVQTLVDQQTGAPTGLHFFQDFKVLILKPDPTNQALKDAVSSEQANVSKAQSAEAQANADKAAANAPIAVAQARAVALKVEHDALGDDWAKKYAIDHGMNPYPNPVVAGQAPAAK